MTNSSRADTWIKCDVRETRADAKPFRVQLLLYFCLREKNMLLNDTDTSHPKEIPMEKPTVMQRIIGVVLATAIVAGVTAAFRALKNRRAEA